jgi:hypothetical protein
MGYAGYNDWRIPNVKELQSIVDYGRCASSVFGSPPCFDVASIDPIFGPTAASFYWSSTSVVGVPTFAWFVFFDVGVVSADGKHLSLRVRAVRGGQ